MNNKPINVDDMNEAEIPCLLINDKEVIVLLTGKNSGTVVYSDDETIDYGTHSTSWDFSNFKYYTGTLRLTQQEDNQEYIMVKRAEYNQLIHEKEKVDDIIKHLNLLKLNWI